MDHLSKSSNTPAVFYGIVVSLLFWLNGIVAGVQSDLRCYCNLPNCIPYGYMCKATHNGHCFFFIEGPKVTIQGCTHLLPLNQQSCEYQRGNHSFDFLLQSIKNQERPAPIFNQRPIVGCCSRHMCNHVEYTDPLEARLAKALNDARINASLERDRLQRTRLHRQNRPANSRESPATSISNEEMWFKAAVIAVPIAGGFIMLILVLIAIRLLRQDSLFTRQAFNKCPHIPVHSYPLDQPPPYPPLLYVTSMVRGHPVETPPFYQLESHHQHLLTNASSSAADSEHSAQPSSLLSSVSRA